MAWNVSNPAKRLEVIDRLREGGYLAIPTLGRGNCHNVVRIRYLAECDAGPVEDIVKRTDAGAIPVFATATFERD